MRLLRSSVASAMLRAAGMAKSGNVEHLMRSTRLIADGPLASPRSRRYCNDVSSPSFAWETIRVLGSIDVK